MLKWKDLSTNLLFKYSVFNQISRGHGIAYGGESKFESDKFVIGFIHNKTIKESWMQTNSMSFILKSTSIREYSIKYT